VGDRRVARFSTSSAASELLAQASQRKSGKEQPEIAQRNIEISGDQQQVDYDLLPARQRRYKRKSSA